MVIVGLGVGVLNFGLPASYARRNAVKKTYKALDPIHIKLAFCL